MIKNKKLPKYGLGSTLQSASPLLNLIPGWGQIASPIVGAIGGAIQQDEDTTKANKLLNYKPMNVTTNPYMRNGGIVNGFKQYNAPTHENGGQPIDASGNVNNVQPQAEIEGTENKYKYTNVDDKSYVFSDKNKTSDLMRMIMSKYKNKNVDTDKTTKNAMELEIKKVEKINEIMKQASEQEQAQQMSGGGGLNVMTLHKEQETQRQMRTGGDPGVPDGLPFQMGLMSSRLPILPLQSSANPVKPLFTTKAGQYQSEVLPLLNKSIQSNLPAIDANMLPKPVERVSKTTNEPFNFTMPKLNYGKIADTLKAGLAGFDTLKAMTAEPDKVDPRLTDYTKADTNMYNQNIDVNQAMVNASQAANVNVDQINNASTSNSSRMSRLQGVNANLQNTSANLALQAQQMKNNINQGLGQYEANKALDNSNKMINADDKFAQNTASARMMTDTARQSLASLGQDYQSKQNASDQFDHAVKMAQFKTADGMAALSQMATSFGLDGLPEYQAWLKNPNDENLSKYQAAAKLKFKG